MVRQGLHKSITTPPARLPAPMAYTLVHQKASAASAAGSSVTLLRAKKASHQAPWAAVSWGRSAAATAATFSSANCSGVAGATPGSRLAAAHRALVKPPPGASVSAVDVPVVAVATEGPPDQGVWGTVAA